MARAQFGAFNHLQAIAAGHNNQSIHVRLQSGEWEAILRRVYRLGGTQSTWEQNAMAAHLAIGEPSALSFNTAAEVFGYLNRMPTIHISTTKASSAPESWVKVHRVDELLLPEIRRVGPLPVTSERRTVLDLAATNHGKIDWVLDACLRDGTPLRDFVLMLDDPLIRGRRGVARLTRKLIERDPTLAPSDSDMEDLAMRHLRKAGLELPQTQWPERISTGPIRLDLAWPDRLFAVELDSLGWHLNKGSFESDRLRDAELSMKGWLTARVTWATLRYEPERFIQLISYHLASRPRRARYESA